MIQKHLPGGHNQQKHAPIKMTPEHKFLAETMSSIPTSPLLGKPSFHYTSSDQFSISFEKSQANVHLVPIQTDLTADPDPSNTGSKITNEEYEAVIDFGAAFAKKLSYKKLKVWLSSRHYLPTITKKNCSISIGLLNQFNRNYWAGNPPEHEEETFTENIINTLRAKGKTDIISKSAITTLIKRLKQEHDAIPKYAYVPIQDLNLYTMFKLSTMLGSGRMFLTELTL